MKKEKKNHKKGARTRKSKNTFKNLEWHEDVDSAFTDYGEDEAITYNAYYKGYYIKVYPVSLFYADEDGWEFEIIKDRKGVVYNSLEESNGAGDHARTASEAKKWAIETLETILKSKGKT